MLRKFARNFLMKSIAYKFFRKIDTVFKKSLGPKESPALAGQKSDIGGFMGFGDFGA